MLAVVRRTLSEISPLVQKAYYSEKKRRLVAADGLGRKKLSNHYQKTTLNALITSHSPCFTRGETEEDDFVW